MSSDSARANAGGEYMAVSPLGKGGGRGAGERVFLPVSEREAPEKKRVRKPVLP